MIFILFTLLARVVKYRLLLWMVIRGNSPTINLKSMSPFSFTNCLITFFRLVSAIKHHLIIRLLMSRWMSCNSLTQWVLINLWFEFTLSHQNWLISHLNKESKQITIEYRWRKSFFVNVLARVVLNVHTFFLCSTFVLYYQRDKVNNIADSL